MPIICRLILCIMMGQRERWRGYEKLLPVLPHRTDMSPPGRQGEKWTEHDFPHWKSTCHNKKNLNLTLFSWQNQTFRRRWAASSPSQRDWLLEEAWSCLLSGRVERWAGYLFYVYFLEILFVCLFPCFLSFSILKNFTSMSLHSQAVLCQFKECCQAPWVKPNITK